MRRKFWCWSLVLLLISGHTGWSQQGSALNRLMADKLRNAQRLLEGIAIMDFAKVQNSADELIQISHRAEWFAFKTPRYEVLSNEFRRAAEVIVQKAKMKNLDGVSLAYLDMVQTCVRCHQYVREVRDARLNLPQLPGISATAAAQRD